MVIVRRNVHLGPELLRGFAPGGISELEAGLLQTRGDDAPTFEHQLGFGLQQ
jgi:hypothetical protein